MPLNSRLIATEILVEVMNKHHALDNALLKHIPKNTSAKNRSLIKALCFGTIRWYDRLLAIASILLNKPLANQQQLILNLLLLGLFQLIYTRIPDYAALSETVNTAKQLRKPWAVGLLNKTLRLYQRNKDEILAKIDLSPVARYSHPQWLIEAIQKAWPEYWESILDVNNTHPPMSIRVNPLQSTREDYLKLLMNHGIPAKVIPEVTHGLQLIDAVSVDQLPHFNQGACSVQDGSGQWVIELLDLNANLSVLDACAAPGSKTTHILEVQPNIKQLTAIDKDPVRLKQLEDNIARLNLNSKSLQLITADVSNIPSWWDKKPFDRILVDVPCSAIGVIRRHPDIKQLRRPGDIKPLAKKQYRLLEALWPLLKPGGKMMYTTCTILPEETERVIESFIKTHTNAKIIPIIEKIGLKQKLGRQILPTENGMDGFYYAILEKKRPLREP